MKVFIILISVCFFFNTVYSQNSFDEVDHFKDQFSPEAASIIKYGDIPVGNFTGSMNFSIPITTIESNGIKIPISLNYNSGGIKVDEESSWVGLGWSLNVSGQIVHVVKGGNDNSGDFSKQFGKIFPNSGSEAYDKSVHTEYREGYNQYNKSGEAFDFVNLLTCPSGQFDGEPDLYIYHFGAYSGKFFIANGEYYDIGNNNIVFKKVNGVFSAITPDGYCYTFNEVENADIVPNSALPQGTQIHTSTYHQTKIETPNGHSVSFVYKSFGELVVNLSNFQDLSHKSDWVRQCPQVYEYYQHKETLRGLSIDEMTKNDRLVKQHSIGQFTPKYLDKIIFNNGEVVFEKSPRQDLYGFKLDAIKVFVKNKTEPVKYFNLDYSYFSGSKSQGGDHHQSVGQDQLPIAYPYFYKSNRLKLKSITNKLDGGSKHEFKYYEDRTLPLKTSYAQDFWGYYNGEDDNTTLVPDFNSYISLYSLPDIFGRFAGANRQPNLESARLGSLKSITYPTGASSVLEYGLHRYTNVTSSTNNETKYEQVSMFCQDYNENGTGTSISEEFTIPNAPKLTKPYSSTIYVTLTCDGFRGDLTCWGSSNLGSNDMYALLEKKQSNGQWVKLANDKWDVSKASIMGVSQQYSYDILLEAGTYRIVANYPDNLGLGYPGLEAATMKVTYYDYVNNEVGNGFTDNGLGGGLRIESITNFNSSLGFLFKKSYNYQKGIMTRFPNFYHSKNELVWLTKIVAPDQVPLCYFGIEFTGVLGSTTFVPYSYAQNQSFVGYATVEVENHSLQQKTNGKEIFDYFVSSDSYDNRKALWSKLRTTSRWNQFSTPSIDPYTIEGIPSIPQLKNGALLKHTVFIEGNLNPIKEEEFRYEILNPKTYWNFKQKWLYGNYSAMAARSEFLGALGGGPRIHEMYFMMNFYPVNLGKVALKLSKETFYDDNGAKTSKVITYKYSNQKYYFVTNESIEGSNGYKYETNYSYPFDYQSNSMSDFIKDMMDYNIVANPIEIVAYKRKMDGSDINILNGQYFLYNSKSVNGFGKPFQKYSIKNNEPIPLSLFKFSNISNKGELPESATGSNSLFSQQTVDVKYASQCDVEYIYDSSGNIQTLKKTGDVLATYLWAYENQYPIIKGSNVNYATLYSSVSSVLETFFNGQTIEDFLLSLSDMTSVSAKNTWKSFNDLLRAESELSKALITTYTYDPLFGITSQTDFNGITTYYEYDDFGRLKNVKDDDNHLLQTYDYHYSGEVSAPVSSTLNLSQSSLGFGSSSSSQNVSVTSNVSWTASDNSSWISVNPVSGSNNGSVSVTCTSNGSTSSRLGTVTIVGGGITKTISISQAGIKPPLTSSLSLSTYSLSFGGERSTNLIKVTSTVNWTVATNSSWLKVSPASGSNVGSFTIDCYDNPKPSRRTGTVTVVGGGITKIINVTQFPGGLMPLE